MKYPHIVAAVHATPWMITEEKLREILSFIEFKANGGSVSAGDVAAIREEQREPYLVECDPSPMVTFTLEEIAAILGEPVASEPTPEQLKKLFESREWGAACRLAAKSAKDEVELDPERFMSDPGGQQVSRSRAGAIAVLPLHGTISHRMGMMSEMSGGTSCERFSGWLKAALADPQVKSIVMDIDSPGGTVSGVQELADEIYKGRDAKPIVAVANSMAASAAYYLGSQASELVVTPSGEVGSIGVFAAHEDISKVLENEGVRVSFISAGKYKTEANPYEPLSADARDAMQSKVNDYYSQFTSAVARGRNVAKAQVESGFGEGRMVMAKDAVKQGMADRVGSFDQTLARMGARTKAKILPSTMNREAAEVPAVVAPVATANLLDLERRRRELELY